jgi:hypothetical protein
MMIFDPTDVAVALRSDGTILYLREHPDGTHTWEPMLEMGGVRREFPRDNGDPRGIAW